MSSQLAREIGPNVVCKLFGMSLLLIRHAYAVGGLYLV